MKSCPGKRRYDKVGAELAIIALRQKNDKKRKTTEVLRAYLCRTCKAWHVTSQLDRHASPEQQATHG